MPNWNNLSDKQKSKVRSHLCTAWTDIEIYTGNNEPVPENRPITKFDYIRIEYTHNGKRRFSKITARTSHYDTYI